ncbi:alpha/beta fold hydrolase [Micromonospora sp. C31]|nr:alpha/beta fold hydrolase [Micromonospora sp. C31]
MPTAMIEMDDGVRLRTWTTGSLEHADTPLVVLHGGPGLPDYLGPVAALVEDLCMVHRYDQRGTGGSAWEGEHTIARHVRDLALLLDAWGHDRVVLVGHSFGTNMAGYFTLAHPGRVGGIDTDRRALPGSLAGRRPGGAASTAHRRAAGQARRTRSEHIAHRRRRDRVPHPVVVHRPRRPGSGIRLGAGIGPRAATRQLRDEQPAQRREEGGPARIARG